MSMRKRALKVLKQREVSKRVHIAQSNTKREEKKIISKKELSTVFFLSGIMLITLFFTTYFNYTSGVAINPDGTTLGEKYFFSGTDPYYNMRLIEKTIETGHYPYLGGVYGGLDPLLNYPLGGSGGRPPLFNMLTIGTSKILSLFMNPIDALGYSMQFLPAVYGALLVIPIYFIGKRLFNRRGGLFAALLIPLIPIHISSGHGASYALYDHDSFVLLITVTSFMFLIMSFKEENAKKSTLLAMMAGVFVGAISLTWVAARYIYSLIALYAVVQMIIDIFRSKINSKSIRVPLTALVTGYIIAFPLYFVKYGLKPDLPLYLILIVAGFGAIYMLIGKKNIPWIISIPSIAGIGIVSLVFLYMIRDINITNPIISPLRSLANTLFGGVYHSKVSRTIAEAMSFGISKTILSFGPALYLMAWVAFVYFILWKRLIKKWETVVVFFTVWFLTDMYLSASAGRFLNDLVPLVAILSGAIVDLIITKTNYKQMLKGIKSTGGFRGIKKSVKLLHVFGILFVALLVVLPNVFLSLDAAVPGIEKREMFGNNYSAGFGLGVHTEQYWADAFSWLRKQNENISNEADRPAFISWWDYGFYCVAVAKNPTVADNFQEGIPPAANLHTAQSEDEAIAVFIARLVQGDMKNNDGKISEGVRQIFEKYFGNNTSNLIDIFENPKGHKNSSYGETVGKKYGGKKYTVREENALYHDATQFLTDHLNDNQINLLYRDLQIETGKSIRYYGVEGYDMNIFNVFTFLADKGTFGYETREDDYYKLMYMDANGRTYTVEQVENLTKMLTKQQIWNLHLRNYAKKKMPFFNSMAYKVYVGPIDNRTYDRYASTGYFYQLLQLNHIYAPTEGLKHFIAEYISPVTKEKPMYFDRARECLGMPAVVIAKYYEGAILNGTVTCMNKPMRVAIAVVKTTDGTSVKIKHDMRYTDNEGKFKLIAPAGNISLVLYYIAYSGNRPVEYDVKEITFNSTTDPQFSPISEDEATRRPGIDYNRTLNITIDPANLEGIVFDDVNGNGSYDAGIDIPLKDIQIVLKDNIHYNSYLAITNESGYYNFTNLFPSVYSLTATENGIDLHKNESLFLGIGNNTYNITKPKTSIVEGKVYLDSNKDGTYDTGEEIRDAEVKLIYSKTGKEVANLTTSRDGEFRFTDVIPGSYTINATLLNNTTNAIAYLASKSIDVGENQTIQYNVSLELAKIGVSGYTTYNGNPLTGVKIKFNAAPVENNTAESASVTSNSTTGFYSIKLKPGAYNISASLEVSQNNATTRYSYSGTLSISVGQTPITNFNIALIRED
ncbi:MAG TPA: hypothetical protein ENI49_04690 [Thermoplasmatales archaeon]|nr:hypothetical protein [Thermoplasmatales archaeon]